ncbi:MAG: hypothetical protein ABIR27_03820 [Dokdonella sp.]
MRRPFLGLLTLLLVSGCASTGSNYYSYEDRGDYYYDSTSADVVIDSSGYGYGSVGVGLGFGYGFGGYGYGSPYSYYGYGYQPVWWIPSYPHYDPTDSRNSRAQHERASRSALARRDTIQAPASAKGFRQQQAPRASFMSPYARPNASADRTPSSHQRAPLGRGSAPIRSSSTIQSAPSAIRSAPAPAPMRLSAPPQHPSSRRQ